MDLEELVLRELVRPWWWWINPWEYTYRLEIHVVKLLRELKKQSSMMHDLY